MLNVTVLDDGTPPKSAFLLISINITDNNDHPPMFQQDHYYIAIKENASVGSHVIDVEASDGDQVGKIKSL